jgi:hypothetical protein
VVRGRRKCTSSGEDEHGDADRGSLYIRLSCYDLQIASVYMAHHRHQLLLVGPTPTSNAW